MKGILGMGFIERNKRILTIACCSLIGIVFFFCLFDVRMVNPLETRWVRFGGGDNFQHYVGWRFYRNAPWIRYLTFFRNLNYPIGTTTVVTDSNPIFALFFKIFNNVLPQTFQYNGIWLLMSFGLCGFFAGCIGYRLTDSFWLSLLFTLMALSNPVLIQRAIIHDTLAGHWLILFAVYLLMRRAERWNWLVWGFLIWIGIGIHLYFLPMLISILLTQIFCMIRDRSERMTFMRLALTVVFAIAGGYWLFGYGLIEPSAVGFGELSMNLNAFLNPDGASRWLSSRPTFPLQYEGFNYWGLGMIVMLVWALIQARREDYRKMIPAVFPAVGLILFALSNRITFDQRLLFEFELPEPILSAASIFRSSGRLAWPIFYLVLVWIFSVFSRIESDPDQTASYRRGMAILLTATVILQFNDLAPFYRSVSERVRTVISNPHEQRLDHTAWEVFRTDVDHLEITDGDSDLKDEFALLAADFGWTINKSANARAVRPVLGGDLITVEERLHSGAFEDRTLYVFLTEAWRAIAIDLYPDRYMELDGFGILVY